jgi:hypothetical protein
MCLRTVSTAISRPKWKAAERLSTTVEDLLRAGGGKDPQQRRKSDS